ncbi:MAG: transposase, partial [bacterium]
CPNQTVQSEPTRTRHKAVFDSTVCEGCPLAEECPTQPQKQGRVHYFDEADAKRSQRLNRLDEMPEEKQTLRNNVEATVKEFTRGMNHKGKLRVRGRFRTKLWALCLAMGLNLERIHRYLVDKAGDTGLMEPLKDLMGDLCGYLWFGTDMSWIDRSNQIGSKHFQPVP